MKTPFPGMDPYLENPSLWSDVHNSLIAAIRDAASPLVAPAYYIALERRAYLLQPDDIVLVGRPDLAVVQGRVPAGLAPQPVYQGVLEVDVPMTDQVYESYLEVHEVRSGRLVTLIEVLSPTNKINPDGREQYLRKRGNVLLTFSNLVEIDLLRDGAPMPVVSRPVTSDYRILISRGKQRPRAQLYAFDVRQAIPTIPLPLLPGDAEPFLNLNTILHDLYSRARFDLRLDYSLPPTPPLAPPDDAWAAEVIRQAGWKDEFGAA